MQWLMDGRASDNRFKPSEIYERPTAGDKVVLDGVFSQKANKVWEFMIGPLKELLAKCCLSLSEFSATNKHKERTIPEVCRLAFEDYAQRFKHPFPSGI